MIADHGHGWPRTTSHGNSRICQRCEAMVAEQIALDATAGQPMVDHPSALPAARHQQSHGTVEGGDGPMLAPNALDRAPSLATIVRGPRATRVNGGRHADGIALR